MKLSLNKNSSALIIVSVVGIGFFIAGMFDTLDYFAIKVLLFILYGTIVLISLIQALKNDTKKNRPEDELQDDSN